jgi:hypothetical protein
MTFAVTIPRSDFLEGLKPLKKYVKPTETGDGLITMEEGQLVVSVVSIRVRFPAEGAWPGTVRVAGRFIAGVSRMPPLDNPMAITVRDGRLAIGNLSTSCTVQQESPAQMLLPLNATDFIELLHLAAEYPADQIEAAGLTGRVREAQARADRLIQQAAVILSPLGITEAEIAALVNSVLTRQSTPSRN